MKRNLHVRFCRRVGEGDLPHRANVIRREGELARIREYVANNPMQWLLDKENPDRQRP